MGSNEREERRKNMSVKQQPEGFLPYCTDDTFNDVTAPLFIKAADNTCDTPILAMRIEKKHCNYVGMAHGGCLMTFMDIALSAAVCESLGKYTSTPTINISFDFMAAAKEGDWIEANILSVNMTRTMGFVNAMIESEQGSIARVSGCFKIPSDVEKYPGISPEDYFHWRTGDALK